MVVWLFEHSVLKINVTNISWDAAALDESLHKELDLLFGISTLSLLRRQCSLQRFAP
jgi:hypothetical protein